MKLINLFSLLLLGYASYGQGNACEITNPSYPINKELFRLREKLQSEGIDTIVIYSHWIYTNGYNGYGKVLWKKDGVVYQLRLSHNHGASNFPKDDTIQLKNDSIVGFFFDNQLDSIKENPVKQEIRMSHDGIHFISINWGENQYCFTISNLLVQFNPENKRVEWISHFKEDGTDFIHFDGIRIESSPKKKRKKKE